MQRITGSLGVWVWGYSDSQGGTASKCSVLLGALGFGFGVIAIVREELPVNAAYYWEPWGLGLGL